MIGEVLVFATRPVYARDPHATLVFPGFIRVRSGLSWSIGLHALYNLILLGPALYLQFSQPSAA